MEVFVCKHGFDFFRNRQKEQEAKSQTFGLIKSGFASNIIQAHLNSMAMDEDREFFLLPILATL